MTDPFAPLALSLDMWWGRPGGVYGGWDKTFPHSATTGDVQASCFGDVTMLLI